MDNERIVSMLNGLIEISRDGAEGFRTCADDADDPELKMYLRNRAQSCEEAVRDLSVEVRRYGGDPDTGGTATGTSWACRWWSRPMRRARSPARLSSWHASWPPARRWSSPPAASTAAPRRCAGSCGSPCTCQCWVSIGPISW